jgi:hypothetical protein
MLNEPFLKFYLIYFQKKKVHLMTNLNGFKWRLHIFSKINCVIIWSINVKTLCLDNI